ncbi:Uncharacterized protein PFLU_1969 [Pseudomonas [fluorescens] SBW25]|uniref:Uncharacterized protein n=1 Tax=Pseudomonas fluorescens (strain SBW25) TaxID=216595 RepID=C3K778_PSEFS|nr:Uncharacterized protein PFLU_1969 [Pseudomonas fluorescens SBW25]
MPTSIPKPAGEQKPFPHCPATVVAHPYTVNVTDSPGCKQRVIG